MKDDLSNRIMEKIDSDRIAPIPHWRFILLRGFFWVLAGLSVVVGSFAVGAMFFLFSDYRKHGLWSVPHGIKEILFMIPYVWIVVFVLFIFIARVSIKYTKQGYRHRLRTIISASLISSVVFGSILYFIGVGEITHNFSSRIPLYDYVTYDARDAFNRPGMGRLSGVVLKVQDKNDFSIRDFGGQIWQVRLASSTIEGAFMPKASSTVRMFGFMGTSSHVFIADSVYEWED